MDMRDHGTDVLLKTLHTANTEHGGAPAPLTHAGADPAALIGTIVRVRPYYLVPTGNGASMRSVRSPYARCAHVVALYGTPGDADSMVIIEFRGDQRGPWGEVRTEDEDRAAYHVAHLHRADACNCPACTPGGPGIHATYGA
jgi:hypothetical protein